MAVTNKKTDIRNRLAIATCSLLAQTSHAQGDADQWSTDISYLSYEEDGRVEVDKLMLNAQGALGESDRLNIDVVYDTMSGATPTGALPVVQHSGGGSATTITGPSGNNVVSGGGSGGSSSFVSLAEFEDDRIGANLEWEHDFSRTFRVAYGVSISDENDYESTGFNIKLEKDDANKISTYTLGLAIIDDDISRVGSGGVPLPLSSIQQAVFTTEQERETLQVLLGYSRVLNERTIAQINWSLSDEDGYHTDPYKVISIESGGEEVDQFYEGRPDSRVRNTLYGKIVHRTKGGSDQHLAYRYYSDDWDIVSHTIEFSQRFNLQNTHYIEPQLRYYTQSEADFYYRSLPSSLPIPLAASSDPRLAEMESESIGIKYGISLASGGSVRFRVEYFDQSFSNAVINENTALILQVSYKAVY